MDVNTLKENLILSGLYLNGKYNHLLKLTPFLETTCYEITRNCESKLLKDRIYWIIHHMSDYPSCRHCHQRIIRNVKNFNDPLHKQIHCNSTCRFKDTIIKNEQKKLFLEKYGHNNPGKVETFKLKLKQTNLEKYGTEHPAHTEKGRITCFKKYGVSNPMQDFKIFQKSLKSRFKMKDFILPSGKIIKFQGYEDVALKMIIDLGIDESEIIVNRSEIPKIFYLNHKTNRTSRYYPDIWIRNKKMLIEVKSFYTFNSNKQQSLDKQQACKKLGFQHLILICDKKKVLEIL